MNFPINLKSSLFLFKIVARTNLTAATAKAQ